ncbi:carbamoyl transferase [Candidatus Dependentiae bacterium]|nr:carbamoyl transferase [Candidatus Dependentiae bacterium]
MSIVLGINCSFHETSAALVKDGNLICAVAEERFNRKKRGKEIKINNPNELPFKAIENCLSRLNISYTEVDYWAISFDPELRLKNNLDWESEDKKNFSRFIKEYNKTYPEGSFGTIKGERLFYDKLLTIPSLLKNKGAKINNKNFFFLPHHLCHAASSFHASGFDNAAILILDAGGEYESSWMAEGKDKKIKKIKSIDFPNSLGFLWIKLSEFCGLGYYGSGKLMGLASWGNSKNYMKEMESLIKITEEGFETNEERILAATDNFSGIEDLFKLKRNRTRLTLEHEDFQKYADIASALQERTIKVVLHLIAKLKKMTNSDKLCLAGGLFLNCHVNQKILESELFNEIYICPAATDDGTAAGAAFEISSRIGELKNKKIKNWFFGNYYTNDKIEEELKKENLAYRKFDNIEMETAKLLHNDKVIAWFQDGFEFGPRALGCRSILANPLFPNKERLNSKKIKDRENFRPVCPSVIEHSAKVYFSIKQIEQPHFNMLSTTKIKKDWINKLIGIKHPDDTARIQLVSKENKRFYNLLDEFRKLSGVGVIINTSFNSRGEPIVNSPKDAIKTFKKCKGIDYLVIGDFIVKRWQNE